MIDVRVQWRRAIRTPAIQRITAPVAQALAEVGQMIYARITGPNVDATGRRLPALARKGSYYVEETQADGTTRRRREQISVRATRSHDADKFATADADWIMIDGKLTRVTLYDGGYAKVKERYYRGRGIRDGKLTGSMWDSLKVNVGLKKAGSLTIKLLFSGNAPPSKQGVKVRQRTKAEMLMFTERAEGSTDKRPRGKGRPMFELLKMNPAERAHFLRRVGEEVRRLFASGA